MSNSRNHTLFNFFQGILKTDLKYLLKGMFWLNLNTIAVSVFNLLIALLLANFVDIEIYGLYKFFLSFFEVLSIFTLFGFGIAIVPAIAKGYDATLISALKIKIKAGFIGVLIVGLILVYFDFNKDYSLIIPTLIVLSFIPLRSFNIIIALFQGKKMFKQLTQFNYLVNLITLIFLIPVIFIYNNISFLLLAFLSGQYLTKLFFFLINRKKIIKNRLVDNKSINYGLNLSFLSIFSKISENIDSLLIFYLLGPVELAIYSFAKFFPQQINSFVKNFEVIATPRLSIYNEAYVRKSIFEKTKKLIFLLFFIVTIYIFISPFLFKLFLPQYLESITLSKIFVFYIIFNKDFLMSYLNIFRMTKKKYFFEITTKILHILIIPLFLLKYGLIGAVIGSVFLGFSEFVLICLLILKK